MTILGDMVWYRADSYGFSITIKNKSTGAGIDLTGYTILFSVNPEKDPADKTNELFQSTGVLADQVSDPGKVTFTPLKADTENADIGTYYYDVQMAENIDRARTIAKFKFTLKMDITKD